MSRRSEQGEEAVEEGAGGWFRVAVLTIGTVGLPLWLLVTAIVIQLSPELNGTVEPSRGEWSTPMHPATWFYAGRVVAGWMCFALPFVLATITVGRFIVEALRRKEEAERARYDELVADDAVIDDPAWREPIE